MYPSARYKTCPKRMDFVGKKKSTKRRDSSLKVVYISSPMKVKTSASKFRTIVQQLTGRDSDISCYMDGSNGRTSTTMDFEILPETFGLPSKSLDENDHGSLSSKSSSLSLIDPLRESPTSSDSLLEQSLPFGDVFMNSQIDQEQYLQGLFSPNLFGNSRFDIDVLGSYDAL